MTSTAFHRIGLVALLFTLLALDGAASVPGHPSGIKVQVVASPTAKHAVDGRLSALFATSVCDILVRQGLAVEELRSDDEPAREPVLLRVELTEWRVTKEGDFSCTFDAVLRTPQGEQRIGTFADTRWWPGVISPVANHPFLPASAQTGGALAGALAQHREWSANVANRRPSQSTEPKNPGDG